MQPMAINNNNNNNNNNDDDSIKVSDSMTKINITFDRSSIDHNSESERLIDYNSFGDEELLKQIDIDFSNLDKVSLDRLKYYINYK
jgi:hypothetical protein